MRADQKRSRSDAAGRAGAAASDAAWMQKALAEARRAATRGDIPVGAVAVAHGRARDGAHGRLIARASNTRESANDPLGHAEIVLLKKVSRRLKSWRLTGVTVYVTLEPCLMCLAALKQARIPRLVYGTKSGNRRGSGRTVVRGGVLAQKSSQLLKDFFKSLR